jgi:hypothetical protein
LNPE